MTRSQSRIPFHKLKFNDDLPSLRYIEDRLRRFLKRTRRRAQERAVALGRMSEDDCLDDYELVESADLSRIKRRAIKLLERMHSATGMYHLSDQDKARLTPLRDGLPISRIVTEHEADEIAAALHAESPWMAPATEVIWRGLRASARNGLPGIRFDPLVLVGSPGIGKSHWARRLAHHLVVPVTEIDGTGEPASFALVGSQRGWSGAQLGKLMKTILEARHGGPLVIIDEIEKVGETTSTRGTRHALSEALLPLLERMTAERWQCPFFQASFDMSWVNFVMTANSRVGLPEPLISRAVILDLPDLTVGQLRQFTQAEAVRRNLPEPARDAIFEVFDRAPSADLSLSLRTVSRMLDRAEALISKPILN